MGVTGDGNTSHLRDGCLPRKQPQGSSKMLKSFSKLLQGPEARRARVCKSSRKLCLCWFRSRRLKTLSWFRGFVIWRISSALMASYGNLKVLGKQEQSAGLEGSHLCPKGNVGHFPVLGRSFVVALQASLARATQSQPGRRLRASFGSRWKPVRHPLYRLTCRVCCHSRRRTSAHQNLMWPQEFELGQASPASTPCHCCAGCAWRVGKAQSSP